MLKLEQSIAKWQLSVIFINLEGIFVGLVVNGEHGLLTACSVTSDSILAMQRCQLLSNLGGKF